VGVPGLGCVEVGRDGVEDAVDGRYKPLASGEAGGTASLDALARQLERGFQVEPEQTEALERTDAEFAIGFAVCGDAIRLSPLVVRPPRIAWGEVKNPDYWRRDLEREPMAGNAPRTATGRGP
jgi:hypothetical protein